jgi:hypothetical protein
MRRPSTLEPTRYELVLTTPSGRKFLVSYTARKTRPGLFAAMSTRREDILAILKNEPGDVLNSACRYEKGTLHLAPGCTIGFSGRTQRDVATAGNPLPYIGTQPAKNPLRSTA